MLYHYRSAPRGGETVAAGGERSRRRGPCSIITDSRPEAVAAGRRSRRGRGGSCSITTDPRPGAGSRRGGNGRGGGGLALSLPIRVQRRSRRGGGRGGSRGTARERIPGAPRLKSRPVSDRRAGPGPSPCRLCDTGPRGPEGRRGGGGCPRNHGGNLAGSGPDPPWPRGPAPPTKSR